MVLIIKAEYEKIIKLTKKKYIKALKKAIVLKFKNHFPKNHFIEIPVLKKLATATKKPFFPFDEPQLKTLNTIQLKHAESIFNDVLDQQELLAKNTFKVIETMDNKSILKMLSKARYFTDELEKLSKENSQFKGLYKKWDKVDEKLFQSLCKTKTEIGGDKKLPVYAGEHTISLGDFACAAKINDLDVVEYTKPGFFGGDTYSMKFVGTDGDNLTLSLKAAEIVPGTKALIGKSYRDSGAIEEQLTKDQWLELVLDFIQSAESMTGFTFERKALSESTQSAGIFRKIKDQFFGENTGKTDNNRGYEGIYNCDGFGVHDLELKKDGKGYATFGVFGVKQKTAITYEVDDDNLVISGNGQNHVLNLEHGMLKDEGNPKIFGNCKPVQIN